jgi:hypothetical protein
MATQVRTAAVTIERIMRDPAFELGAVDVRAGLPFRRGYDSLGHQHAVEL